MWGFVSRDTIFIYPFDLNAISYMELFFFSNVKALIEKFIYKFFNKFINIKKLKR